MSPHRSGKSKSPKVMPLPGGGIIYVRGACQSSSLISNDCTVDQGCEIQLRFHRISARTHVPVERLCTMCCFNFRPPELTCFSSAGLSPGWNLPSDAVDALASSAALPASSAPPVCARTRLSVMGVTPEAPGTRTFRARAMLRSLWSSFLATRSRFCSRADSKGSWKMDFLRKHLSFAHV